MKQRIIVTNHSEIPESDVHTMVRACNLQLREHCAPAWDAIPWPVAYRRPGAKDLRDNDLRIVIFNDADEPDALGYHAETPDGQRYGKVFVNPILEAGGTVMDSELSVSTTLSHETLEAFVDPDINLWSSGPRKRRYAIEVCDPVESDAYRIVMTRHYKGQEWFAHVFVSNFVYRAWFDLENPKGTQYDHMKRLKKPFELSPGGYAIYEDARGEHAIFAKGYPRWKRSGKRHAASRTSRRLDS